MLALVVLLGLRAGLSSVTVHLYIYIASVPRFHNSAFAGLEMLSADVSMEKLLSLTTSLTVKESCISGANFPHSLRVAVETSR